jgi:hypothetical protein
LLLSAVIASSLTVLRTREMTLIPMSLPAGLARRSTTGRSVVLVRFLDCVKRYVLANRYMVMIIDDPQTIAYLYIFKPVSDKADLSSSIYHVPQHINKSILLLINVTLISSLLMYPHKSTATRHHMTNASPTSKDHHWLTRTSRPLLTSPGTIYHTTFPPPRVQKSP